MAPVYLKQAVKTSITETSDVQSAVSEILARIEQGGDKVAAEYARKFDNFSGPAVLSAEQIATARSKVPQRLRDDMKFAHDNIRRFAQAQKETMSNMEMEISPGVIAGQRMIPVSAAGCYVPGGRYAHVASAMMTVTTAQVAGVQKIVACSPPSGDTGISPGVIYAADLCGADHILSMGGVQGVAAMAFGLFGLPKSDIIVGPGNQFVAEAKRQLFGRVGIDMIAGPTDTLILADKTADAHIVAADLVGQAEHGYNSPVWLVTDDLALAEQVLGMMDRLITELPELNRINAQAAWRDYGEVILCSDRTEMAAVSDDYAPEHLSVHATDLSWWLETLTCYGSLFLGEETTVAYGDKSTGPNHVLPTSGSARYTGGLSVHKYMKVVTWQRATREGAKNIAQATARISRLEGMEGHARTADIRLQKYFPKQKFDLAAPE
ncbi:histidinol dehydrogenase [Amylibacter marinus]|uniref:Histidinol dehydrogenase n=1 Tax=Amylibacter marinus TaxID=1475483 RepID=A0ABQ5VWQ3_9RHOB|nr:histidinol dehydrogenase [Amylibacter marinus]GLQ35486.1 histidinol dehydrogenase [Amylibacter marinus]